MSLALNSSKDDREHKGSTPIAIELRPNLIPRPLENVNGHDLLKKRDWQMIRSDVLAAANNRCSICSFAGLAPEAHEQWEYDDNQHIASLTKIIAICQQCHHVIHFGQRGTGGYSWSLVEHIQWVNQIDRKTALVLLATGLDVWHRRSRIPSWSVRVGRSVLMRYPKLAKLQKRDNAQNLSMA